MMLAVLIDPFGIRLRCQTYRSAWGSWILFVHSMVPKATVETGLGHVHPVLLSTCCQKLVLASVLDAGLEKRTKTVYQPLVTV
jgi:hypothetical protein